MTTLSDEFPLKQCTRCGHESTTAILPHGLCWSCDDKQKIIDIWGTDDPDKLWLIRERYSPKPVISVGFSK